MGEAYRQKGRSIIRRPARWGCVFFLFFSIFYFLLLFLFPKSNNSRKKTIRSEHIIPFYTDTVLRTIFSSLRSFFIDDTHTYFQVRSRSECVCNEGDRSINCLTSSIMLSMRFGGENCHCVHYTHHRASKKINNNTKSGLYYIPFCFFAFLFFLFHLISMSYIPEQMPASCSFLFLPPIPLIGRIVTERTGEVQWRVDTIEKSARPS
jgi:Ca2+/Na+ antiporter